MAKGSGISLTTTASVAIAALILGKAVLLAEMVWPHFWAIQILLLVLIIMYCTIDELVRAIGKEKIVRMFFGPLPVPNSPENNRGER